MERKEFVRTAGLAAGVLALGVPAMALAEGSDGDLAADVQYLKDRAEIEEAQYRYALGIDSKDVDLLISAFDETISAKYIPGNTMEDIPSASLAQGIIDNFVTKGATTQHFMNVMRIEIDGDTASATTYLRATHVVEGTPNYIVGGRYDNTYVRTESGWRIKTVQLTYEYEENERNC